MRALPVPAKFFGGPVSFADTARNIFASQKRGLPLFDRRCERNPHTLSIVGGGPSLRDTVRDIKGRVLCVNGAHDTLLEYGIVPHACVLIDPMPDLLGERFKFTPQAATQYFLSSACHPNTFDRLRDHRVVLVHFEQGGKGSGRSIAYLIPPDSLMIGGGGFATLRGFTLGYMLGFRDFHLHGMDSSARRRSGAGVEHHANSQSCDDPWWKAMEIEVLGYPTVESLYLQVSQMFGTVDIFERAEFDPVTITVHGEGLLQTCWRNHFGSSTYTTQPGRDQSPADAAAAA